MNYKNYSISASKGKLYLKAKQPTEGYEEVIYGTDNNKKKTYHLYVDSIQGSPKSFEVKEIQHDGKTLKFIELVLVDGEDINKVSAPLKNIKGNYTDEAKALISSLYNINLGEPVTLTVRTSTTTGKNNKEYKNLNIYINYVNTLGENGKGLSTGFIPYTEIPAPIEKEVAGDKTWDWSPQTEFFYGKLKEIQDKFKSVEANTTPNKSNETSSKNSAPKANSKADNIKNVPAPTVDEDDSSDLPF